MEMIAFVETTWWLLKHARNVYNSVQLADDIEEIHRRITDVYSDIATAHFIAARDALQAAKKSMSPQSEIRASIGHLREAFNILELAMNKKVMKKELLFFKSTEDAINNRKSAYHYLAHLGGLIAIMYNSLKEPENAQIWKQRASQSFSEFFQLLEFKPEELEKIDKRFVQKVQVEVYEHGGGVDDIGFYSTEEKLTISPLGTKYISDWKAEILKQFLERIDSKILKI